MANARARAPRSPLRSLSTGARRAQLSGMRRLRQSGAATTIGDDGRAQRIHVNNRRCDTYGHERSSPCALHLLTLAIIACDYDLGKSLALSHAGHLRALRARSALSCNAVFCKTQRCVRVCLCLRARRLGESDARASAFGDNVLEGVLPTSEPRAHQRSCSSCATQVWIRRSKRRSLLKAAPLNVLQALLTRAYMPRECSEPSVARLLHES